MSDLEARLAQLDVQKMLNHWNTQKALAEINVQLVALGREGRENGAERVIQQVQCTRERAEIAATTDKLHATRASLVAQLQAKTQESALLDFDIEQHDMVYDEPWRGRLERKEITPEQAAEAARTYLNVVQEHRFVLAAVKDR